VDVYISTGAFPSKELTEIIAFSIDHGIHRIELSSGITYNPRLLDQVRNTKPGPMKYLVHNYFPPSKEPFVLNLASSNEGIRARSLDLCESAIDLSAQLEAPFYSVHAGFTFDPSPDLLGKPKDQGEISLDEHTPYDEAYAILLENVINLAERAHSKGLRLLIENNVVAPAYLTEQNRNTLFMATADEILRFIADVDHPAFGVLIDTGHVNVTATALNFRPKAFVETLSPHIGAFHLSENNGREDENLPFGVNAWFYPMLKNFPDVPVVIEAYNLTWEQMETQFRALEVVDV
jgi:sugar phosphate isomerase/epimerase